MGACHAAQGREAREDVPAVPTPLPAGKCPVTGASGQCPARGTMIQAQAAAGLGPAEAANRSKVRLAELPVVPKVVPSDATLADLEFIKACHGRTPLSAEDIVVVKGAWNRTLAFKDAMMEAMVYRWTFLDPKIYDLLKLKFDELPHDLFQMIDRSVCALDPKTEVHHRESYTAGFPSCVTRDFGNDPADIMSHYTLMGVRSKHWALLKEAFLFAMRIQTWPQTPKRDLPAHWVFDLDGPLEATILRRQYFKGTS